MNDGYPYYLRSRSLSLGAMATTSESAPIVTPTTTALATSASIPQMSSLHSSTVSTVTSNTQSTGVPSIEEQLAAAEARLLALTSEEENLAKRQRLANLLQQCSQMEARNQNLATNLHRTPAPVAAIPIAQQVQQPSTSLMSSLGIPQYRPVMSLGQGLPVTNDTLRQYSGIQQGVQDLMRSNGMNALSASGDDDDQVLDSGDRCKKSGKHRTITSHVQTPQKWPHSYLKGHFVGKERTYEQLSIPEFCAGYSTILQSCSSPEHQFRLSHFTDLMYYATTCTWPSVLSYHAACLMEIERGTRK